jgi:uncharacterized protein YndB with AHSA1/START domain
MTDRSIPTAQQLTTHGSFALERTYPVPPSRVFEAFRDPALKRRWSVEADDGEVLEHKLDFRVGGREITRFRFGKGSEIHSDTSFEDIVPDSRIVLVFRMRIDGRLASVAMTTVELVPTDGGTQLTYTEQGVFVDGLHNNDVAEHGTGVLLQRLGETLVEVAA